MSQHEDAVLTMSDLHYGKKTSTYDPKIFRSRLDSLHDKLARLRDLQRNYEIDCLHLALLGDVNDGSGIYPTQPFHQTILNVEQQADELADLLSEWVVRQQPIWGKIDLTCIPGNHGRVGKFAHEAASWDVVTYRYLAKNLRDKVLVDVPETPVSIAADEDLFIRKVNWRGHNFLLYHGHEIRSYASIPWYGMLLRLSKWSTSRLAPFDVAILGHFHSFGHWQINRLQVLCSGTMVSNDEWALQSLGWESASKWHLFGVSDSRPITWQYAVELT